VIALALISSHRITHPVRALDSAVARLAGGDFSTRVEFSSGDEFDSLGRAFNAMVPQLHEHARVRDALSLAREVQQRLLPPHAPVVAGYDVHGVSLYSDETGGDYFDYLPCSDGRRFDVVVADVSGHGIGPALLMATTRALLHADHERDVDLGGLLGHVNRKLADDVGRGHFVTVFIATLAADSNALEWASAGHDGGLLCRADGSVEALSVGDIPLGIDASWAYHEAGRAVLAPGDVVVIATDGVWEAANPAGERFGRERLNRLIASRRTATSAELCQAVIAAVADFRAGRAQHDDLTLLVIRRTAST
jgi:sigma-B regulation protein RsbU (phosphoserine phosphatase)